MDWLITFLSDFLSQSLAGVLGGAIGGIAVLFAQNRIRRSGLIEAEPKKGSSKVQFLQSGEPATDRSAADEVHYAFTLHFFNGKPADSGHRGLEVVFYYNDRVEFRHTPDDRDNPEYSADSTVPKDYEEVDLLNLPSGQWVRLRFGGRLSGGDAEKARNCDRVQLQGYLFGGEEWKRDLPWD